jgi:hypothetical protein
MCLKKHVQARGQLVNILPQEGQGNLARWEVDTVWIIGDLGGNTVVGVVVDVRCKSVEVGGAHWGYVQVVDMNAWLCGLIAL